MRAAVPVRARPIAILLMAAIALVACGGPPPPDLSGSRAVTFESRDGVTLEGRLFGDGSTGVVLSHMRPADQRSWFAFANRLADDGVPRPHVRLPRVLPRRAGRVLAGRARRSRRSGRTCSGRWTSSGPRGRRRSRSSARAWVARRRSSRPVRRDRTWRGRHALGTDVDRGARRRRRPAPARGREQAVHRRASGTRPAAASPRSSTRWPRRRSGPRSSPPTTTAPTC